MAVLKCVTEGCNGPVTSGYPVVCLPVVHLVFKVLCLTLQSEVTTTEDSQKGEMFVNVISYCDTT